jgi:hypothetical protein
MAILLKAIYRFTAIPIRIPIPFFREKRISHKIHLEAQKNPNSQRNSEQKEQYFRYHNTWLQITLQNHSNKNSMVLVQKQTHRSMEQKSRSRNRPTTATF